MLQEKDACKGTATRWYFANMGLAVQGDGLASVVAEDAFFVAWIQCPQEVALAKGNAGVDCTWVAVAYPVVDFAGVGVHQAEFFRF